MKTILAKVSVKKVICLSVALLYVAKSMACVTCALLLVTGAGALGYVVGKDHHKEPQCDVQYYDYDSKGRVKSVHCVKYEN